MSSEETGTKESASNEPGSSEVVSLERPGPVAIAGGGAPGATTTARLRPGTCEVVLEWTEGGGVLRLVGADGAQPLEIEVGPRGRAIRRGWKGPSGTRSASRASWAYRRLAWRRGCSRAGPRRRLRRPIGEVLITGSTGFGLKPGEATVEVWLPDLGCWTQRAVTLKRGTKTILDLDEMAALNRCDRRDSPPLSPGPNEPRRRR